MRVTVTSSGATLAVYGLPVLVPEVGNGGGSYTLNFSGPASQTYKVLYSTNVVLPLSSWKSLTTGSFSGGTDSYTDSAPADIAAIIASP